MWLWAFGDGRQRLVCSYNRRMFSLVCFRVGRATFCRSPDGWCLVGGASTIVSCSFMRRAALDVIFTLDGTTRCLERCHAWRGRGAHNWYGDCSPQLLWVTTLDGCTLDPLNADGAGGNPRQIASNRPNREHLPRGCGAVALQSRGTMSEVRAQIVLKEPVFPTSFGRGRFHHGGCTATTMASRVHESIRREYWNDGRRNGLRLP